MSSIVSSELTSLFKTPVIQTYKLIQIPFSTFSKMTANGAMSEGQEEVEKKPGVVRKSKLTFNPGILTCFKTLCLDFRCKFLPTF